MASAEGRAIIVGMNRAALVMALAWLGAWGGACDTAPGAGQREAVGTRELALSHCDFDEEGDERTYDKPVPQLSPAAARVGGRHVLCWLGVDELSVPTLNCTKIEPKDGNGMVPKPTIDSKPLFDGERSNLVAAGGKVGLLLVWQERGANGLQNIIALNVGVPEQGRLQFAEKGTRVGSGTVPAVSYNHPRFLIAWQNGANVEANSWLDGGAPSAEQVKQLPAASGPAVAPYNDGFVIAYEREFKTNANKLLKGIGTAIVASDGSIETGFSPRVLDTNPSETSSSKEYSSPALAGNGDLVQLACASFDGKKRAIETQRLLPESDDLPVVVSGAFSGTPSIDSIADDQMFLVSWTHTGVVLGATVRGTTGKPIGAPVALAAAAGGMVRGAVVSVGSGNDAWLSFESHVDKTVEVRSVRIDTGKPSGCNCDPGAKEKCATDYCINRTCCKEACGECERCGATGNCEIADNMCPNAFACDPVKKTCRTKCSDTHDCARGYQCFADGSCKLHLEAPAHPGCSVSW
jgi:hypothetical protein